MSPTPMPVCLCTIEQCLEAGMLNQRLQHPIALVASPAERERLVVVEQVLQVWRRFLACSSEIEGAEARVALVDEHHRLLKRHGLPDLELACSVGV
jgi:hypothetical protein